MVAVTPYRSPEYSRIIHIIKLKASLLRVLGLQSKPRSVLHLENIFPANKNN